MNLSRKAEYAMRAAVALARRPAASTCQIEELSAAEHIPVKFLEQILLTLRKADILRSKRGLGGGYQLNRPATEISLGEIVKVIEGPYVPVTCASEAAESGACECGVPGGCGVGRVFRELQGKVNGFLDQTSLADVVQRERADGGDFFEI